nr:hypothetical protein B5O22.30 [imported] - Neurospora crassa [Neurospora crassa]
MSFLTGGGGGGGGGSDVAGCDVEVGTVIGGWYQLRLFDFGNMKGSMVVGGSGSNAPNSEEQQHLAYLGMSRLRCCQLLGGQPIVDLEGAEVPAGWAVYDK